MLGLTVTPISGSQIDLGWTTNPEPDVAHYNVYRGTTAGFAVNTATDTPLAQPTGNSYSDTTGLTESTTYYYKVAAVDKRSEYWNSFRRRVWNYWRLELLLRRSLDLLLLLLAPLVWI